jgi:hypothetical protein
MERFSIFARDLIVCLNLSDRGPILGADASKWQVTRLVYAVSLVKASLGGL